MAKGDIMPFENAAASKTNGSIKMLVQANSTGSSGSAGNILPGEPVTRAAGVAYCLAAVNNSGTTTLRIAGIAANQSTETASVDGTVDVIPSVPGQLWMIKYKAAGSNWDTQAHYNGLIGDRMLIDLTTGSYTILATDGASQACVVQYNDIAKYPGYVVFTFSTVTDSNNV
jgi:hypothetical protein